MSEGSLWQALRNNMRWQEATRHEDAFASGIADVSYCAGARHGWLELKFLPEWPKRVGTVVRLDHFTDDQRIWLRQKGRGAGSTWLLLQVGNGGSRACWYGLFRWNNLDVVGTTTRDVLTAAADYAWSQRLDYAALEKALASAD